MVQRHHPAGVNNATLYPKREEHYNGRYYPFSLSPGPDAKQRSTERGITHVLDLNVVYRATVLERLLLGCTSSKILKFIAIANMSRR